MVMKRIRGWLFTWDWIPFGVFGLFIVVAFHGFNIDGPWWAWLCFGGAFGVLVGWVEK